jgi:S1-C subfamily serine protease
MKPHTLSSRAILFAFCIVSGPLLSAPKLGRDVASYEHSILSLSVTRAVPDPESPWAMQNSDVSGHAAVVIAENMVLTQASIISRAVYIQAQKVDDVSKIPMRVIFADYEANLAILAPTDGHKLNNTRILPLGPDIPVGSDVTLVTIENERHLQRVSMRILDIGLREASVGGMTLPMYSLGGQSRSSCSSDLIVRNGMLVGICVGVVNNEPQVITAGVLSHFFNDKLVSPGYRGFGSFGVTLSPVKSPWHRKILGVDAEKGALRVAKIFETSPFNDCLAIDDVVIGLDKIAVDHRGFYPHAQWGAVPLRHYIVTKYAGDQVAVKYRRKGESHTCSRQIRKFSNQDQVVAGQSSEGPIPHMIFGGLVFRELNADFLSIFGREWQRISPPSLLFVYDYQNEPTLTRRREIVLSHVLGDSFNSGYEKLAYLILDKVNGNRVSSLEELGVHLRMAGVMREGMEFAQFDFRDGTQVVLPYDALDEVHRRISRNYAVTDFTSFFKR